MTKVPDPVDRFADANGIRVRYRIEGQGPDIVLIHGVGANLESWDGVVAILRPSFRLIRYDLRGHVQSDKPAGPYDLDGFTSDLRALLDAVGIDRCHVAGFSLGGLVAQSVALSLPDRVDHLMLISTVAGRTDEERRRVLERLDMVANGIPGGHFQNSLSRWFTDDFRKAHPDIIAAHAEQNRRNDPAAYAAAYRVLATSDLADRLHEIKCPTLIATGEHDIGSNPRMARLMHERIAGSRLHILPGLRHSILLEAPHVVAALIDEFVPHGSA